LSRSGRYSPLVGFLGVFERFLAVRTAQFRKVFVVFQSRSSGVRPTVFLDDEERAALVLLRIDVEILRRCGILSSFLSVPIGRRRLDS